MQKQTTISADIKLSGVGLHSGRESQLLLSPADEDTGFIFLHAGKYTPLKEAILKKGNRRSIISLANIEFFTIEHVLSALYGMEIDNVLISLSSDEPPIFDGSAKLLVDKIRAVGIRIQNKNKNKINIETPISLYENGKFLIAFPYKFFKITYFLHYDHKLIGSQTYSSRITRNIYCSQIAPARTFALEEEISSLFEKGLAKGGSIDNAIIVFKEHYSCPLRFPNEFVRHKVLDLIGDIALICAPINAHIIAIKTGHSENIKFVNKIKSHLHF